MGANRKTTPTPTGNLDPWATTEPGFSDFFSITVPGIPSWLNIVFIHHPPTDFCQKGEYEINPQVYSFNVIFNREKMRLSLGLQYMPENAHQRGFQFAEYSLPPPTSEIVTDKIPHPSEKCQLKPTTPSGKKRLPSMGGARIFAGTTLT